MEATMIYPVIVVITVTLIAISLYIYNCGAAYSDMTREVKRAAGYDAGTVIYGDASEFDGGGVYDIYKEKSLLSEKYNAVLNTEYSSNFVISAFHSATFAFECSSLNEAKLIWDKEFASDIVGL